MSSNVVVGFGEIMTRLSSPGFSRLRQCLPGTLDASFAGAESNIASAVAVLGGRSRYVTALPRNVLGDACVGFLGGFGVQTQHILRSDTGRMAQYFIETGAGQRPGRVLYDREHSTFSLTPGAAYDWEGALNDAAWLVITGISPALSPMAAEATLYAARQAKERGVRVCCDLNFRASLWNWEPGTPPRQLARRVMGSIMPHVDLLLTNPEQAEDVLGIPWNPETLGKGGDSGRISEIPITDSYGQAARRIGQAHPHIQQVVFTMRESLSASHNNLGALLYDLASDRVYLAPLIDGHYAPYQMQQIVDRLGAGDAFAGALLYAMHTPSLDNPQSALSFAVAAGCLAHTIPGDINLVTRSEVEALSAGDRSGRVKR